MLRKYKGFMTNNDSVYAQHQARKFPIHYRDVLLAYFNIMSNINLATL